MTAVKIHRCAAESCEHEHRPEFPSVAAVMDAAGEWILRRIADIADIVYRFDIIRSVHIMFHFEEMLLKLNLRIFVFLV